MSLKRILSKIKSFPYILNGKARPSYSQVGEDRIIEYFLNQLNITKPIYLDVGANHPVKGNNTYFFYTQGGHGVLVEPDPSLHSLIGKSRPNDKLITSGVALQEEEEADFYIYAKKYNGWNTFSSEEVEVRKKNGIDIERKIKVPLVNINDIIENNFDNNSLDILSIDVEGLDEEIIRSLNFEKYSPKVICIESIRFGESDRSQKENTIIDFVKSKNYEVYADTFVNTIFCRKDIL